MKVYLGGAITGLTFAEAREWRLNVAMKLDQYGITTLDPLRGKSHLASEAPLGAWFDGGSEAVARDLQDIRLSDIVLLNFLDTDRGSIGTCAEMGYAYGGMADIVVVRNTDLYDHVFVDYMADATFDNLDDALDYIISRRTIADPEGGRGVHGSELPDGAEGYRGWLIGSDEAPGPVEDQPVRPAQVAGGRRHPIEITRETYDPRTQRVGW